MKPDERHPNVGRRFQPGHSPQYPRMAGSETTAYFLLLLLLFLFLFLFPLSLLAQDGSRIIRLGTATTATTAPLAESAPAGNAGLFVGVNTFDKRSGLADLRFAVNDAIGQAHLP